VELALTCETNSPQETDTETVFINQASNNPIAPNPGGGNDGGSGGGNDSELEQFQ